MCGKVIILILKADVVVLVGSRVPSTVEISVLINKYRAFKEGSQAVLVAMYFAEQPTQDDMDSNNDLLYRRCIKCTSMMDVAPSMKSIIERRSFFGELGTRGFVFPRQFIDNDDHYRR
jgi:hypothetical protein